MFLASAGHNCVTIQIMGFWENVEAVREYRDIPRKELAYKANFSLNCISTGIARNSVPSADVACRIADVLDVTVEFLVTGGTSKISRTKQDSSKEIEKELDLKKSGLLKYMNAYSKMLEDFSKLSAPMQKVISEMIHLAAK